MTGIEDIYINVYPGRDLRHHVHRHREGAKRYRGTTCAYMLRVKIKRRLRHVHKGERFVTMIYDDGWSRVVSFETQFACNECYDKMRKFVELMRELKRNGLEYQIHL